MGLIYAPAIGGGAPHNEFYWPPPVPVADALDLDAANQWWDKVGTPTGGVIYTTATASSISTLYGEEVLKCVAAGSGDGLKTTWTYANERRVKSGTYMAILCAVYLATAGRTVTVSLKTSTPTTIDNETVTTDGAWQLVALEPGSTQLDGSSALFEATLNGAGTFYVVPLGALIATAATPRALQLPPRKLVTRWRDAVEIKSLTGLADEATWTDIDVTATASALAVMVNLTVYLYDGTATDDFSLHFRRNGSSEAKGRPNLIAECEGGGSGAGSQYQSLGHSAIAVLDDAQVFEYFLDRNAGTGTLGEGLIHLRSWLEWA